MKNFTFFILLFVQNIFSQTPAIAWQKTLGGNEGDVGASMIKTSDGGYIIGGSSDSGISGEKTHYNRGGSDFWVIKLNNQGQIEWQKTIGGNLGEGCQGIIETNDGYVLVGGTMSGVSADKTLPRISNLDNIDLWVVKIDKFGGILWQKEIGQVDYNYTEPVITEDKEGNILIGSFKYYLYYNPNGNTIDCFQNKTYQSLNQKSNRLLSSNSASDYYIAKFSSNGDLVFEKTIGGLGEDVLRNITVTQDGNYLLSGYSNSNMSLDKTSNTFGNDNKPDIWLVKLAQNGDILWQNIYGGDQLEILYGTFEMPDGNLKLICRSISGVSGNRTLPVIGSIFNIWIVTINSVGQIVDQQVVNTDNLPDTFPKWVNVVAMTSNQDFLFAGGTYDNVGQVSKPHLWKVSNNGDVIYERSITANQFKQIATIFETNDLGVIVNLFTNSGIAGDKTDYCRGDFDIWLVKLFPENLSITTFQSSNTKIFPNPTTSTINIDFGQKLELATLTLTNVLGQTISSQTVSNLDKTSLEINESSGVYFLEIVNDKPDKQVFKVVKQ